MSKYHHTGGKGFNMGSCMCVCVGGAQVSPEHPTTNKTMFPLEVPHVSGMNRTVCAFLRLAYFT